jgi:hypothetical protein
MSQIGFIVFLHNNAIGIYDNEEILNNFINGCYQNKFFSKNDIKIKKYSMNTINCLNSSSYLDTHSLEGIQKLTPNRKHENNKQYDKNKKELEESIEYKNLMQLKIDTKHQINQLKKEKQKLEEEKQTYEYDIKMYEKLKIENSKIENFEIPDIFNLKFNIFKKL